MIKQLYILFLSISFAACAMEVAMEDINKTASAEIQKAIKEENSKKLVQVLKSHKKASIVISDQDKDTIFKFLKKKNDAKTTKNVLQVMLGNNKILEHCDVQQLLDFVICTNDSLSKMFPGT